MGLRCVAGMQHEHSNSRADDRFAPTEVANLFEHLVGAAEQRRGDIDAERFSGANEPRGAIFH